MALFGTLKYVLLRGLSHRAGGLATLAILGFFTILSNVQSLSSYLPLLTDNSISFSNPAAADSSSSAPQDPTCHPSLLPHNTTIIIKTGANELFSKVPTQLLTSLSCQHHQHLHHPNPNPNTPPSSSSLLFFSDLPQSLGPHTIHDALSTITPSTLSSAPEFEYYRHLHHSHTLGRDLTTLTLHNSTLQHQAWSLDKFKFLPMLSQTFLLSPPRDWYVFIEADTYLLQHNLRLFLDRLDPSRPHYLGSPTSTHHEAFAHGGSGFILSGTALRMFAEGDPNVAQRFETHVAKETFGDYALMKGLQAKGVGFERAWPWVQGERVETMEFGLRKGGRRQWCQPVVTLHHVGSEEAQGVWEVERRWVERFPGRPFLIKDLYEEMVADKIVPERDDWDNLSDDVVLRAPDAEGEDDGRKLTEEITAAEREAYLSFEHCRLACKEDQRCFQFAYRSDRRCGLSHSYRLGGSRSLDGSRGPRYRSGWDVERMARDQKEHPCHGAEWM